MSSSASRGPANGGDSEDQRRTSFSPHASSATLPPNPPPRMSSVACTANNPTPHKLLDGGENARPLEIAKATNKDKVVIIMVGLPACGKTHIACRIKRFLHFFHDIDTRIFNVGEYRRDMSGAQVPASFFDSENPDGVKARAAACDKALSHLIEYMLEGDGVRVGILDATNSNLERRKHVRDSLRAANIGAKVICIESVCNDEALLDENIRNVKLKTEDYKHRDPDEAVKDFMQRREHYKAQYEGVVDADGPHVIIHDCKKFVVYNIRGYLPLKIVQFVMNLHTLPRTFYFTRHGQSEYNRQGKIGGDSSLSKAGVEYAERLAKYAREHVCVGSRGSVPARLWTSTLKRTKETARFIEHPKIKVQGEDGEHEWEQLRCMERRNLDELYAGKCDGMTYKEIEETFPNEFEARQEDKLAYRYPRGESYMDVILRLEPLAHEMERTREPILIIGHQGILRILYAYFMGLSRSEAPYVSIPLNHVLKLTPHAYGCNEEKVSLMTKEDMKNCGDGQDEPVTSMPLKDPNKVGVVKPKVDALATAVPAEHVSAAGEKEKVDEDKAGVARGVATSASFRRFESENTSGGKVREEDPVLDVPSC